MLRYALRRPHDRGRLERGDTVPVAVDGARLGEHVTAAPQFRDDAHPLSHVEAGAPEIDQVATSAEFGRPLDQRRLVPCPEQPVRERRAGDSRTHDQDLHATTSSQTGTSSTVLGRNATIGSCRTSRARAAPLPS